MSVTLVKITPSTIVYVTGHNTCGYSPDPDSLSVHATIESARSTLAWELDSLADFLAEGDEDAAELAASVGASAEYVKHDTDGDIAYGLTSGDGWGTMEDTGRGIDSSYWIQTSTLGEAFGDDTDSDEYLDVVDELRTRGY